MGRTARVAPASPGCELSETPPFRSASPWRARLRINGSPTPEEAIVEAERVKVEWRVVHPGRTGPGGSQPLLVAGFGNAADPPARPATATYTLYTARHQFSANAKSSDGLTRTEIAALMGHASIYTAGEHYGKRRSGRGRLGVPRSEAEVDASERQTLVFPHVDDLRMVQALEQERQRRREQRTTSKLGPGMG